MTFDPPVITLITGQAGAGKSTIAAFLADEVDHSVVHITSQKLSENEIKIIDSMLIRGHSFILDVDTLNIDILNLLSKATALGFQLDTILIYCDDVRITLERSRKQSKYLNELNERNQNNLLFLPVALDRSKRMLIIDNSTGLPKIEFKNSTELALGQNLNQNSFLQRLSIRHFEHQSSKKMMHAVFERLRGSAKFRASLTAAKNLKASVYSGLVIERSEDHILQQVSDVLYVLHDVALIKYQLAGEIIKGAIATISYKTHEPGRDVSSIERNNERDHSR